MSRPWYSLEIFVCAWVCVRVCGDRWADAAKVRAAQKDLTADYDGQAAKRVWAVMMEHCTELQLFPKTERNVVLLRSNNY